MSARSHSDEVVLRGCAGHCVRIHNFDQVELFRNLNVQPRCNAKNNTTNDSKVAPVTCNVFVSQIFSKQSIPLVRKIPVSDGNQDTVSTAYLCLLGVL